jgi:membrane fusion protein, multidrug efflux system
MFWSFLSRRFSAGRGAPGAYAYVVNADNKVSAHNLALGPAEGDIVAVESGLAVGDRVVIDGADQLRDGSLVKIPEAPAPAPAKDARPNEQQRQHRRESK